MKMKEDEGKADCLACRIISGTGLIGAASYILYQSKKSNKLGKLAMKVVALGNY